MKNLSIFMSACFCLASFAADPVVPAPAPALPRPVISPAPVTPAPVPGAVTVRPITPESVKGELVADKVVEIPLINRVQILAPRFVFSQDFGYGTELLPDLIVGLDTTSISHWICAQYGYGRAAGVFGTRPVISKVLMQSRSNGRPTKGNDLYTSITTRTHVAANLTCSKN